MSELKGDVANIMHIKTESHLNMCKKIIETCAITLTI